MTNPRQTIPVGEEVFREVYDSPASLPGKHRWVTPDVDVRAPEKRLGMPAGTIGAPLWVSGDRRRCASCGREVNWLDIVTSALEGVHDPATIAQVILGERRFVNTEAPEAIRGVRCANCGAPFGGLRSFKCHNWAYAKGTMQRIVEKIQRSKS